MLATMAHSESSCLIVNCSISLIQLSLAHLLPFAREREVLQRERRMEYLALKQRWQEELEPDEVRALHVPYRSQHMLRSAINTCCRPLLLTLGCL